MTIKKLQRNPTTISIAGFHEQNQLGKFNYDPPYQRKSVWTDEKQSYFIDSILRNFPVPAIFLHRKIDPDTGRTSFDVIDGKQRLTAIARFINNEIPAANEYGAVEEPSTLDGSYFRDLSSDQKLSEFRNAFWKFDLPIEYIDPTDIGLIEDVFDRLNRNGEPLKGQELRNAKYHSSNLMKGVESLLMEAYFKSRLVVTDLSRMEDREFCSECLLSVQQGEVLGSSQEVLDALYEARHAEDFSASLQLSREICANLDELDLDYQGSRISGVSHLYGLWSLALVLHLNGKSIISYKKKIQDFYTNLRNSEATVVGEEYKKSMSSRTKERYTRIKRLNALLEVCGETDLILR